MYSYVVLNKIRLQFITTVLSPDLNTEVTKLILNMDGKSHHPRTFKYRLYKKAYYNCYNFIFKMFKY